MIYRADILKVISIPVEVEADCLQDADNKLRKNLGVEVGEHSYQDSQITNLVAIEQGDYEGETDE